MPIAELITKHEEPPAIPNPTHKRFDNSRSHPSAPGSAENQPGHAVEYRTQKQVILAPDGTKYDRFRTAPGKDAGQVEQGRLGAVPLVLTMCQDDADERSAHRQRLRESCRHRSGLERTRRRDAQRVRRLLDQVRAGVEGL